jgi:hypothetical protein
VVKKYHDSVCTAVALFDDLVPRAILAQWDQNVSEVYIKLYFPSAQN